MQKVVSFDKKLEFKTMIGEVTSISLDQELSFLDDSNISGELIVSGKYKLTSASRLEEDFNFYLPIEIVLTERLEKDTRNVKIEDFRYEIGEDDTLNCHIELLVEGVEIVDDLPDDTEITLESTDMIESTLKTIDDNLLNENRNVTIHNEENHMIEEREKKTEMQEELLDNDVLESNNIQENMKEYDSENVGSLFSSLKDSNETFATYSVYIFRSNDTIDAIIDKYHVSK